MQIVSLSLVQAMDGRRHLELFCNPMNVILHRKTSDIGEYSEEVKIICFASKQSHARDLRHGRENNDRDHVYQRHIDE